MRHIIFVLLAVVGMLPASLLPVMVTTARHGLGFTIAQSASFGATAIVCAAIGALTIAMLGVPKRWEVMAALALVAIGLLDLASMTVTDVTALLAIRAVHGFAGGMLTGIGYAGIGQAAAPDRFFGVLLAVQFLVGGAGIALLPGLIIAHGAWSLFAVLATMEALVLALVPIVPDTQMAPAGERPPGHQLPRRGVLWGLIALLFIQAGHTAAGAFMLELGNGQGIAMPTVQSIVGLSAMAGVIGAVGAALLGIRWGRRGPVLLAGAAGVTAGALLLVPSPVTFAAGAFTGSIAWAWSIPFVLGGCAAFDPDKRVAVWLSFVAKLGLAIGPLLGALVVVGKDFAPAIILSCALGLAGTLIFVAVDRIMPAPAP